jgi:formate hydrogenlyase subunit 4
MNIISLLLAAALAPLIPGIVNQTKAFFAGRRGPGIFRLYAELFKLLRKSTPRPSASTWVFDIAQPVSLASVIAAAAVFPWSGTSTAAVPVVLFFYLLAAGRFFTVIGALDAGNAFEGMGASREVQFAALAEPVTFIILGFLVLLSGEVSLAGALSGVTPDVWRQSVSLQTLDPDSRLPCETLKSAGQEICLEHSSTDTWKQSDMIFIVKC